MRIKRVNLTLDVRWRQALTFGAFLVLVAGCGRPSSPHEVTAPAPPSATPPASDAKRAVTPPVATTKASTTKVPTDSSPKSPPSEKLAEKPKPASTDGAKSTVLPKAKKTKRPKPEVYNGWTYNGFRQCHKAGVPTSEAAVPAKLRIDGRANEWPKGPDKAAVVAVDEKGLVLRLDPEALGTGRTLLLGPGLAPGVPSLGWHIHRDYTRTFELTKEHCASRYKLSSMLQWLPVGANSPSVTQACLALIARHKAFEPRYRKRFRRAFFVDKKGVYALSLSGKRTAIRGSQFAAGAVVEVRLPLTALPHLTSAWWGDQSGQLWMRLSDKRLPAHWLQGRFAKKGKEPCGHLLNFEPLPIARHPAALERVMARYGAGRLPAEAMVSWHPSAPNRVARLVTERSAFGHSVGMVKVKELKVFKPIATVGSIAVGYLGDLDEVASLVQGKIKATAPASYFVRHEGVLHFFHKNRTRRIRQPRADDDEKKAKATSSILQSGTVSAYWSAYRLEADGSLESVADTPSMPCCDGQMLHPRKVRFFYDSDFKTLRLQWPRSEAVYNGAYKLRHTKKRDLKQVWRWDPAKKRYALTESYK